MSQAITVTTKATASLEKITAGVAKAVQELQGVTEVHGVLLEQVAEAQQNLDQITADTAIAVRKANVEIDLQVEEHKEQVLTDLLNEKGLTSIEPDALQDLHDRATRADYDAEAEIRKAVNAALASERQAVALKAAQDSKNEAVEAARTEARIESLESQLEASQREAKSLAEQLSAEREAGVERARAAGSMTINTSSK